jgi:osmotically-inducible protein OsmY
MADYKRQRDELARRHERDWSDRAGDELRSGFGDDDARRRRQFDDRDDRNGYFGDRYTRYESSDRGSRWEGASDDRAYGTYRTDDRDVHARVRHDPATSAADEYYRAAREQRDDYLRWSVHNPEDWGQQHLSRDDAPHWSRRERGGYWRQYEAARPHYAGRGPKGYKRSDDRIRDEICDTMTDDPDLDASEIVVEVFDGEVTLSGSVMSRDQKRRAEDVAERISGVKDVTNQLRVTRIETGHDWAVDPSRAGGMGNTSARSVTEEAGKGTSSKTTSGTSA